ncbi:PIN domain-containing protein [Candidatus Shapirobacteria bacterium]|nr:PIN domain-containing protein [Candidatus Shapirobacteria bacterium]
MAKILVDTDVIIDSFRRSNKKDTLLVKVFSQSKNIAFISLVTIAEIWAGKSMSGKEDLRVAEELLKNCHVLMSSIKTAKKAGTILRQTNYQLSFQSAQIAALAIENKLAILTLNQKDFKKVKGLKLFPLR